jgi:hypothetical protein
MQMGRISSSRAASAVLIALMAICPGFMLELIVG